MWRRCANDRFVISGSESPGIKFKATNAHHSSVQLLNATQTNAHKGSQQRHHTHTYKYHQSHTLHMQRSLLSLLAVVCCLAATAAAQRGPGAGSGPGFGPGGAGFGPGQGFGPGGMMMQAGGMMAACTGGLSSTCPPGPVMMTLLNNHQQVTRQYQHTNKGIQSLTQSEDPQVAALIKLHVRQMSALLDSCAQGRCTQTPAYHDPLFRAIYNNADKIKMQVTNTDKGVRVVEEGKTDAAKLLVQAHAAVVSNFVKNGLPEHHKTHEVPAAAKAGLKLD